MAFAWEGLRLDLSEDWAPTQIVGRRAAGYVRLNDGGPRVVQLRWQGVKGQVPLEKRLRQYLARLSRDAKGKFDSDLHAVGDRILYRYSGPVSGRGLVTQALDPERVVFAEVTAPGKHSLSSAERLLSGLALAEEDDLERWSLLGLDVRLPQGAVPGKRELFAGKIRVLFRHAKGGLDAQRWGLADRLLEGRPLADWAAALTNLSVVDETEHYVALARSRPWPWPGSAAVARHDPKRNAILLVLSHSRSPLLAPEPSWLG